MHNAGYPPTLAAAHARIAAVQPAAYARTRNALQGAVTGLSPYITHGFVTLREVVDGIAAHHAIDMQHKLVFELGWRVYFRHVWQHRGDAIFQSLHEGVLPDECYACDLPMDIRNACTGVPVIDQAVRTLYATGTLHNHARMWLASYVVHLRKVHWRVAADWLYGHLLDGDLASNHLSWQWVAGTGSSKPYLFNAENVARFAPAQWHSSGSVVDHSYEELERIARQPGQDTGRTAGIPSVAGDIEPALLAEPPDKLGCAAPHAGSVAGRDVWLVHPWSLGQLPADLPADTVALGVCVEDFHQQWPWSARRWQFVGTCMAEQAKVRWFGDADAIKTALSGARSVQSTAEPHLALWLDQWAECRAAPALFAQVDRRCDSFSKWWTRVNKDAAR